MDKLKDVSVGAWVLLSVIVASLAAIVIFAPPTMWAALGKADWPHVAGVIGLVGSALVGVFVEWRKATVSVKAGPLVMLLAASMTLGMASGCGASASQVSARAVTVAAGIAQGAARVVADGAEADTLATCPEAQYPDQASTAACAVPVRARWAPADALLGSTRAALVAWVEMTQVAHLAGDDGSLWMPLALAAARLVAEYDALRAVLVPLGVTLPVMPALVADLAASIGGQ